MPLAALVAAAALAGDMGGPTLGFVADSPNHSVRVIRGIPGAATWGGAVDLGSGITSIAMAPRLDYAVLSTAAGVRTVALSPDGAPSFADPGLPAGFTPTLIAFSPAGSTAALYDARSPSLWLLRNGASTPVTALAIPGTIRQLAVSDGDDPLIAAVPASGPQSVFVLNTSGASNMISVPGGVAAIAFVGQSRGLAIAGRNGRLFMAADAFSANAPQLLSGAGLQACPGGPDCDTPIAMHGPGGANGRLSAANTPVLRRRFFAAPLALASSADGKYLAAVSRTQAGLLEIDTGQWSPAPCDCASATLAPLHGNAVFRLSGAAGETLWILDGDSPEPRTVFVPAANPAEGQP